MNVWKIIWIVTFYSIALFFIEMSIFTDKTSIVSMLISIVWRWER